MILPSIHWFSNDFLRKSIVRGTRKYLLNFLSQAARKQISNFREFKQNWKKILLHRFEKKKLHTINRYFFFIARERGSFLSNFCTNFWSNITNLKKKFEIMYENSKFKTLNSHGNSKYLREHNAFRWMLKIPQTVKNNVCQKQMRRNKRRRVKITFDLDISVMRCFIR